MTLPLYTRKLDSSSDIDSIAITDHSMAVYFPYDTAWSWSFISDSKVFDRHRDWGNERMEKYLDLLEKCAETNKIIPGLETEMMLDSRFNFDMSFRKRIKVLIGAVHYLPFTRENSFSEEDILRLWEKHVVEIINSGVDILAHPFRWLSGQVNDIPGKLVEDIVDECMKNRVALELNSHKIMKSDILMLRTAAEKNAVVSLGSDSHRPDEICDLSYHFDLMKEAGLSLNDLNILSAGTFLNL